MKRFRVTYKVERADGTYGMKSVMIKADNMIKAIVNAHDIEPEAKMLTVVQITFIPDSI